MVAPFKESTELAVFPADVESKPTLTPRGGRMSYQLSELEMKGPGHRGMELVNHTQ